MASPASGHDLRLDERLKSKRRQLLPPPEDAPRTRSGGSSEGGVSGSGLGGEVDMDWREEIRLASQLPEDDGELGVVVCYGHDKSRRKHGMRSRKRLR